MTAIVLNGAPRDLPAGATVADAVRLLVEGAPLGIAVALNGEVVPRGAWAATALAPADRVEVLTAAQGG